jgi:uncharacterized membrane protein
MGALIVLGILFLLGPLILSIITAARFGGLNASVEELKRRISKLEGVTEARAAQPTPERRANPPPLPDFLKPPPVPIATRQPETSVPKQPQPSSRNWESILGVKLFAWIGGLALFLGVVFFIKYAVENNWTTPTMRIVTGVIVGTALIILSLFPAVRRYRAPAQSVCATGILILYADIYAAYSFYGLIPLTAAAILMWIVTGASLILASHLEAQSVAWLGVIGGFLTPVLFSTNYDTPLALFGYIGVLNFGVAVLAALKRWNYLIILAAIGSVVMEATWVAGFFGSANAGTTRIILLAIQAQFLVLCVLRARAKSGENWSIAAGALTGFAPLVFCLFRDWPGGREWDFIFPIVLLCDAGLIGLAITHRESATKAKGLAAIVGAALLFTWFTEWAWNDRVFEYHGLGNASLEVIPWINYVVAWHVAVFLLFAGTPYFCGTKRLWPWMIAALTGPLQFWFVHRLLEDHWPHNWQWLLPIAFALPAAIGVIYLVKREHVALASGDSRLATQGAAVLGFVSLIFPVQFEREWITLGWAFEGLALILLFRWIPNRRLRAVALIVLCAAFARLALNPAVFEYHLRIATPILNWYLYAYGFGALCLFLSARWFGDPREKTYERGASPLLYSLSGIVMFLLMNIEIADYFSKGLTLTFSFSGNFARDMTYTIAWSLFALALLVFGIGKKVRAVRFVAIALLLVAFAKLFLHDLDSLNQLYRIGAFIAVAVIAIVASFIYQKFLSPVGTTT